MERLDPGRHRRLTLRAMLHRPAASGWVLGLTALLSALLLVVLDRIPGPALLPAAARLLRDVSAARADGRPLCLDAGANAEGGGLRYPGRAGVRAVGDGGEATFYLVSSHARTAAIGLLPSAGCGDLQGCVRWAADRLSCGGGDPPGTLRRAGTLVPDPDPEAAELALSAGGSLAVLPAARVHPGWKVVAGPFDGDGGPGPDREELLVTLTGLLEEPPWLEALRSWRYRLLPEGDGRPPLQHLQGLGGGGWIYVPIGPRWGEGSCGPAEPPPIHLIRRLGELVRPPVRQSPILVSLLGLRGVDRCLRGRLSQEANAGGFLVSEVPADLQEGVAPPFLLRGSGGEVLAIWEMEISDPDLPRIAARLRASGAPALRRFDEVPEVFHVAVVHWTDGPSQDTGTRRGRSDLLDTLAGTGFDLVTALGERSAGTVRALESALVVTDLGDLSGPGDLMHGVAPPSDLAWVVQCTHLDGRPFQCYLAAVLHYLGEPALFREPRSLDGTSCWWRGDEFLPLFGDLAGTATPCYPALDMPSDGMPED